MSTTEQKTRLDRLTEREQHLLVAVADLQRQLAGRPDPFNNGLTGDARTSSGRQSWQWAMERDHGPRIARLYGDGYNDAARKRVSRALAALAAAGLVELWGQSRNTTHVRLSLLGEEAARAAAGGPAG